MQLGGRNPRLGVNHVHCCLFVIVSCVIQFLCFTDFHMIPLKYLIYDAINDVKKRLFMHWSILIRLIGNMMDVPIYGPLELLKVPIITMCMLVPFMFWTEVLSWNTHKLQCPICWVAKGRLLLNYFLYWKQVRFKVPPYQFIVTNKPRMGI